MSDRSSSMRTITIIIQAFTDHQRARGFSRRTTARRAWTLAKLFDTVEHDDLAAVTPEDVEAFLIRFDSLQTRYSLRSDIRQFYVWAIIRGHATINPTDTIAAPRLPKRDATPLAADDLARAINTATGRTLTAVLLGAHAGLRVSEIARLHRRDIHLDRGVLVVRDGKGGRDGAVPLTPRLARNLQNCTEQRPVGGDGQAVSHLIRTHFRRLGIEARPHDLRHSFGTEVARVAEGNLLLVAELMRHENAVTSQRYIRWHPRGGDVINGLFINPTNEPPCAA